MIKQIVVILFVFICGGYCSAQEEAGSDVSSLLRKFQKDPTPENAYQLGVAYQKEKEHTKAIIYLSKATLKNVAPVLASNAYLYRGITRIMEKKYNDGFADLRKSLALNPRNAEAYRHRGMAEILSGDYIKAVQDISTYTMYADKSWELYNTLANDILNSGTTNKDLIDKAHDLALLSAEKNKNSVNQQTLNNVSASLEKNTVSVPKDKEPVPREVSKQDNLATSSHKKEEKKSSSKEKAIPSQPIAEPKVIVATNVPVVSTKTNAVEIPDFGKIRKAKVWAVVIGVSKYTTTKSLNLKYANTDADLFFNFLRSPAGGNIPAEQISLITNEKATRTEILKTMKSTFGKAYDSDVIILYIASHGQTENGEFYFLTTEAEPGFLDATALSRNSVADAFNNKSIRAKKKIIFADACHSGELMKVELGTRGNDESMQLEKSNQLLVEMAQSNEGCAIMTASTGGQKSYEDAKWGGGHGIFTYSLIEGLKGKADYDENNIITLNEINEYVFRNVTEATQRKQQPSFQGTFDDNFPMSIVIK